MRYRTRKMIAARDLNSNGTLFGGRVLDWIDEEAFIYASCQLESESVVTRTMSEINFVSTARQGEVVEIGMETVSFGRTSITLTCEVRNRRTRQAITAVDRIVFVLVDEKGAPTPHGMGNASGAKNGALTTAIHAPDIGDDTAPPKTRRQASATRRTWARADPSKSWFRRPFEFLQRFVRIIADDINVRRNY